MGLECGWRHAQKRWAENLEDFEKDSVEVRPWCWEVEVRPGSWDIEIGPCKADNWVLCHWGIEHWVLYRWGGGKEFRISTERDLKHHRMRRACVGSDSMVSIVRVVSLLVSKNWSQKLIKPFVPEQQSACLRTCICVVYLTLYECVFVVPLDWYHWLSWVYRTSRSSKLHAVSEQSKRKALLFGQHWHMCIEVHRRILLMGSPCFFSSD